MMASFLSHHQHHVQKDIVEAGKAAEEASVTLQQLNQALHMNSTKIQHLKAELEAAQRAASKYSASLPTALRAKARTDERLIKLKDAADQVAKELAAEKLIQGYLEELRKDDEDSERRLKQYLNEVMKRDAEGYGDSDSESEWSVLGDSVDSLKKPQPAKPVATSKPETLPTPPLKELPSSKDKQEVPPAVSVPVHVSVDHLNDALNDIEPTSAPTPRSPLPSPPPAEDPSLPVTAPLDASLVTSEAAPDPELDERAPQAEDEDIPDEPIIQDAPKSPDVAELSPSEDKPEDEPSTQPSDAEKDDNPTQAVPDTDGPKDIPEDDCHGSDEGSDDAKEDEPLATNGLAKSEHESAVISTAGTAAMSRAESRVMSPSQSIHTPPLSPRVVSSVSPRSPTNLGAIAQPLPSSPPPNGPPIVNPSPIRYQDLKAFSPPPGMDRTRSGDLSIEQGGASLYEHAKKMTSGSARSADYGTLHKYPPVFSSDLFNPAPPEKAPAPKEFVPRPFLLQAAGVTATGSRLPDLQTRSSPHGSIPPRASTQEPIGRPRPSRELPPTPSRTSYPKGDYLSSTRATVAEIYSHYYQDSEYTAPLRVKRNDALGLYQDGNRPLKE